MEKEFIKKDNLVYNKTRQKVWYEKNKERVSMERKIKYSEKVGKRLDEDRRKIDDSRKPKICQDKISKSQLIKMAVDFVNKVESRNGLVSFEELFGEMLNINYFLPSREFDEDSVEDQLKTIWENVKYFARAFKKEVDGIDYTEYYKELKQRNLCKYCEINKIQNSYNACHKCRGIMVYISKLD